MKLHRLYGENRTLTACETGENPLWHAIEQKLYWCDIPNGRIFRFDPATGLHEQCYEGRPVGGFTVQYDGSLLLFMDRGTIARWHDGELTEIVESIPAELESRFNDVIADPKGRVYCGTTVNRVLKLSDGSYAVHMIKIRWPHHVFVSKNFEVTGAVG